MRNRINRIVKYMFPSKLRQGLRLFAHALFIGIMIGCVAGCGSESQPTVVVYTALDRNFSEPIFQRFEEDTGIKVLPKYDTESTKTVGLVNALIAEKAHPRCDVFWNNEIVNTLRLKKQGLLQSCYPENARFYPAQFKDRDGQWYGFAARARVLIVNTNELPADQQPDGIMDLAQPELKGRAGLAKPLFGTTASHVACLFAAFGPEIAKEMLAALKTNDISVESGNKTCAVKVGQGTLAAGLTDTDDAIIEIREGKPVAIVFPDQGSEEMGTLMIPNTLALIKECPHPEAGKKLINYLLSPEIEATLSEGESAQIPLNSTHEGEHPLDPLPDNLMVVDFEQAADQFETAAEWVNDVFLMMISKR